MVKELMQLADQGELSTVNDSELIKQELFATIKDASMPAQIGRQFVDVINQKTGKTLDFILKDADSMAFREIAEGAAIPINAETYTKIQVTPVKYGNAILVSTELEEDANWEIIKVQLRQAGREASSKEDKIIFSEFSDSSTGLASDSNQYFTSAGTELSVADIVGLLRRIEVQNYEPNMIAIHPTQTAELRQIDTFIDSDKVGSDVAMKNGFVGRIFGCNVARSTNVWAIGGVYQSTTQYAYAVDSRNCGMLVIRRPLAVKTYDIPDRDSLGVAITFREDARVVRTGAGCRVTIA